tara:strand:- start:135 stop:551 length:417 start_codon:yes stop_codon:yes gene_type:complete
VSFASKPVAEASVPIMPKRKARSEWEVPLDASAPANVDRRLERWRGAEEAHRRAASRLHEFMEHRWRMSPLRAVALCKRLACAERGLFARCAAGCGAGRVMDLCVLAQLHLAAHRRQLLAATRDAENRVRACALSLLD